MADANGAIITVGLCIRNAEKTIREAVSSIVDQDFPHELMEIIFVDDGSEDDTLKIISDYASRIDIKTKIFHTEWRGLGPARQTVVNNASGNFILWVDGDTMLSKNYVKYQVNFMTQHPFVGIASGIFGVLSDENWSATIENIGYTISRIRQRGKPATSLLSTDASIFRVEALKEIGGFDCGIKGSQEDIDVAYRIKQKGWLFYVTDAVFYHRQRNTWKSLWRQHFWYGYGLHFLLHKNKKLNAFFDRSVDRIPISFLAYRLTHRKVVFLLPLNFLFKKAALFFGFLKGHIDGYGHE